MTLQPGTKLGAFEITGLLGKGGMGEVYRARDTKLGRDVAIKVVSEAVASDTEYLKRFELEARTLASLDHPNISAVYDFQHADGQHFLVMQLIDGETLSEVIRRGPLPSREAIPIFIQIARGLDAAHEAGIVHRDLKPANVKLARDNMVKILDFGIAKDTSKADIDPNAPTTPMTSSPVTGAGTLVGTPNYMSPEQARGKPVNRRTDVWAFGCCLYEALTGIRPYDGETMTDIVTGIIHKDPDWTLLPTNLPRELDRIVRRCLEKDLRRRPSSMNDLAIALEDVESDLRTGQLETVRTTPSISDTASIRLLVVLPFENLMGDEEQNYLVDGMTEALTAELSKIRALKVTSRGSAMRYRKSDKPMLQIAQELGVDGLIEGSIFRAGDGIRITAQLIDGRTDAHLWSESFTGSMDGMLELQGDVALAIAKAIRVVVTPEEKQQLRKDRHQISRKVQKVLWEANYAFNQQNPRGYRDAIRLYERATEMDPDCVQAYVGLAAAHWVPSILGIVRPTDALQKAEQASKRALELDPDSSQAQYTAGYIEMMYRHDWQRSRRHFERAVELSPSSAEAHSGLGLWHIAMLDSEAAVREEEIARQLDPMSPMHANNLAIAYHCQGRYADADRQFGEAIELSPQFVMGHVNRIISRLWTEPTIERLRIFEDLAKQFGNLPILRGNLAWAYGRMNQPREAAALARSLEVDAYERYIPPLMIGLAFQAAGNDNKAFDLYEKAVAEREFSVLYIGQCPWFAEGYRRSDPRYDALLRKLNLPEHARQKAIALGGVPLTPTQSVTNASPRRLQWGIAAIAAVLLVTAGFFAGSLRQPPSTSPSDTNAGSSSAPRIASLAVLPLDNLMEDPEQEYFVDGMTDALTAELSKINSLKVISRTSVMRYKGSDKSAGEIANELGVEGLIEGSVMRVGNEVRITVQLIDAETDAHLWAETYDNTLENVFKLHSEVALAIAKEVQAKVTPGEAHRFANVETVNSAAHEEFLKGLHFYGQQTRESLQKSLAHLEKATELDPNFALAWAYMPRVLGDATGWGFAPAEESYRKSKTAAGRAVALAPDLAMAHYAMGTARWHADWDWAGAEEEFRRAIELSPNDGELRYNYGWMLLVAGRIDEAVQTFSEGIERSPLSLPMMWSKSYALGNARRFDESLSAVDDLLRLEPRFGAPLLSRGRTLLYRGDYAGAIDALSRVEETFDSGNARAKRAIAYFHAGDADRSRQILSQMIENATGEFQQDSYLASVYAHLGEFDRAFEHLRKAIDERHWAALELRTDPVFDPLRSDPRYWELIDRIGYPTLAPENPLAIRERQYKDAIAARDNQTIEKIAVLPFANLSGDPEQEYFVDGMTEALTMELARVKSIKILSRTSAMQYKGVLRPMHEIANELGVDALVEGSVMRAGDQVRITAQLIDGNTDEHLWADRYDGTLEDILNLQSEVALAIAKEVSAAVTPEETAELSVERTVNPEAYEAYLRGMHLWNNREIPESIPHFEKAIELAPDFARAYSGLANAHGLMATFSNVDPAKGFPKSMDLARKALAIDPDLPDARAALAWAEAVYEGDFAASNERFLSIQRDYPDYSPAYYWYATTLVFQGRNEEAFAVTQKAVDLDPIAIPVTRLRVLVYWTAGRYEEAIEYGLQHLAFAPTDDMVIGIVTNAYVKLDRIEDARAFLKQSPSTEMSSGGALYPLPYKQLGMESEGRAVLDTLLERQKTQYVSPMEIGMLYLTLGEVDQAVEYLEDWVTSSTWNIATFQIAASPILEPYKDDPRVKKLLDRVRSQAP